MTDAEKVIAAAEVQMVAEKSAKLANGESFVKEYDRSTVPPIGIGRKEFNTFEKLQDGVGYSFTVGAVESDFVIRDIDTPNREARTLENGTVIKARTAGSFRLYLVKGNSEIAAPTPELPTAKKSYSHLSGLSVPKLVFDRLKIGTKFQFDVEKGYPANFFLN